MTTTIGRDELKSALDAGHVTVVDALPASYYQQRHLPGALNLAPGEAAQKAASLLPDRNAPIVTYCSGPTCQNSTQVAHQLAELGYTNVRAYPGGLEDWTAADLPLADH